DALIRIKEHALLEAPKEACGVLAGSRKEERTVTKVFSCTNVDKNPLSAYTIGSKEFLETVREIEENHGDLELLGFYHSHPHGDTRPSLIDLERATWDGFFYAIYSILEDELRCWKWSEDLGKFIEEEVLIV
ncbi:MAG: Mov34/MPN/PAD-1 family protein, partial [Candidatus Hydrothermarchaeales archaeon]